MPTASEQIDERIRELFPRTLRPFDEAAEAALRAPNFAALRVGVTEGGQVVVEVEHRKLVTPFITNDVENPREFPKIQRGFRQIIEHFERMAGLRRHGLFERFVADPDYRRLAERRLADTRAG